VRSLKKCNGYITTSSDEVVASGSGYIVLRKLRRPHTLALMGLDQQYYKQAGVQLFFLLFFVEICSSDRRARYTRTQTNSFEKEPSHHFEREKP
jgi:hypothetical protein